MKKYLVPLVVILIVIMSGCSKNRENTPEGISMSYAQLVSSILEKGQISSAEESEIRSYWTDPLVANGSIQFLKEFFDECRRNDKSIIKISDIKFEVVSVEGEKATVDIFDNATVKIRNTNKVLPSKIRYYLAKDSSGEWRLGASLGALVDVRKFK